MPHSKHKTKFTILSYDSTISYHDITISYYYITISYDYIILLMDDMCRNSKHMSEERDESVSTGRSDE